METLPDNPELKTAYSVAYAGFRTARTISSPALREALEFRSLRLLLAALNGDKSAKLQAAGNMEYLLAFARDTGLLHPQTAELVLAELYKVKSGNPAKTESGNPATPKPIPATDLFPHAKPANPVKTVKPEINVRIPESKNLMESESADDYPSRRNKILERVRQSGNCRIKDLEEVLNGASERTLRYDLQRLVQEGVLERVGQSGPAIYYRLKDSPSGLSLPETGEGD